MNWDKIEIVKMPEKYDDVTTYRGFLKKYDDVTTYGIKR